MARVSLKSVFSRVVFFTAAGAAMCLIFILLTSFAPPQEAGVLLPEAAEVEGGDKDAPPPPAGKREIFVRVFLQGYYINDGEKKLRRARDHDGEKIVYRFQDPNQSDWITISLHDKDDYSNVLFTNSTVALNVTGYSARIQIPDDIQQEVWVSVKHRNHLETVYFEPIDLGADFQEEVIGLDFTTAVEDGRALRDPSYGENQHQFASGDFAIYAGDVNEDGEINAADRSLVQSHLLQISRGYITEDINGDGEVNASDRSIVQSNLLQIVRRRIPEAKTNNIE